MQVPEYIGRYKVERLLGQGRLGTVYLCHGEQKIDQPVAIKVPPPEVLSRPEDAEAYLAEVRTVAHVDHPHIVPIHDAGSDDKFLCFIVSNYVLGVDLRSYSVAQYHNPFEAAKIIITLAGALDYAHGRNLFHLSLRPGKILVDSERKPWLLADDFIQAERFAGDRWIPGNPHYLSPEQVSGEQTLVGPMSDIFSLGVILYELVTGRGPYRFEGGVRLVEEILNPTVEPPSNIDAEIPPSLDRICARAMARSPEKRYQSMKELASDFQAIIA